MAFFEKMKQVGSWVITFAQVLDIDACAGFPLRIDPGWLFRQELLGWQGCEPIDLPSNAFLCLTYENAGCSYLQWI